MTIATIITIASVVFTADGTRIRWAPRYPETARRLDNSCVIRLGSASQAEREACGWYALDDRRPQTAPDEAAVPTGYVRTADGYMRTYDVIPAQPPVVRYSTLLICRELRSIGKWDAVKSLLTQGGVWDDYYLANYLASNDSVFDAALKAVVDAGILTKAELDALLPKCVWTAD